MSLRPVVQDVGRCLYRRLFLRLLLVSWVAMFCILFHQSFMITSNYSNNAVRIADQGRPEHLNYQHLQHLSKNTGSTEQDHHYALPANRRAFGACLMSKDDNQLLFEWLAYHYTVLPLRYVVIGSDVGNRQDPRRVLQRWSSSMTSNSTTARSGRLHYVVLNVGDDFDESKQKNQSTVENLGRNSSQQPILDAHHSLIRRQKRFISTCIQELKQRWNVHWATFVDSDEFVTWNPARNNETNNSTTSLNPTLADIRRNLNISHTVVNNSNHITVLDILSSLQEAGHINACYTIPRLRFGALENVMCPEASNVADLAKTYSSSNTSLLSTLRFVQHATKGDFSKSKFGKVIMDVSRLSDDFISKTVPRNIHRPYLQYCGPAGTSIHASFLRLNHYLGSWDRYASRDDQRRDRSYWESMASLNDENACNDDFIHSWFPRFIQMVGEHRAKFLLGLTDEWP
jgi:hypothetical protein